MAMIGRDSVVGVTAAPHGKVRVPDASSDCRVRIVLDVLACALLPMRQAVRDALLRHTRGAVDAVSSRRRAMPSLLEAGWPTPAAHANFRARYAYGTQELLADMLGVQRNRCRSRQGIQR